MEDFGLNLDLEDFMDENAEVVEDNCEPEVPVEPKTQPGEIYELGNHRLMCGDATSAKDVEELMGGGVSDLVVTDPPYNVDYEGGSGLKIQNDKMDNTQFEEFLSLAFENMADNLKAGGAFYV